jgi:hypothetical protein
MPRLPPSHTVPFLSPEEMHGLIEEKKSRRENLNIFVLSAIGYGVENYNSELSIFFKLLSKNINDPRIPLRFQLAIEAIDHWFSVDCYIKDGQLYSLILDAVANDSCFTIIKKAAKCLKPTIFAYRGIGIQYDLEHCSFFTLDHLFRLSNRNQHWNDLFGLNTDPRTNIIYFDHTSCPHSLAFIFKNIQSFKGLEKLSASLKTSIINERNQTLHQLILENTRSGNILGIKGEINAGIIAKQKNYMARGGNFFKPANYRKIVSSRQGFEIIAGEAGELIKKIITHKGITYLQHLIKDNEVFIKNNIRDMLDIAFCYDLKNFFLLLIGKEYIAKELITVSDICSLINKTPVMFKTILEYAKDSLSHDDILEIQYTIDYCGTDQFKDYLASTLIEEPSQYSTEFSLN